MRATLTTLTSTANRLLCLTALALVAVACESNSETPRSETGAVSMTESSAYPVDPQAHVDDKSLDASMPGSIHARVLNGVAYARYGVAMLSAGGTHVPEEPRAIAAMLGSLGARSGVSPAQAIELYRIAGVDEDYERYRVHLLEGAQGVSAATPLSPVGRRIVDLEKQLATCTARPIHSTVEGCCSALAVPWFLLDAASKLDQAEQDALDTEAGGGTLYRGLPERKLAEAETAGAIGGVQPFEQQNIKAFLAVCAPATRGAPADLTALKAAYGDYSRDEGWSVELHPVSMAKMAARRIYRAAKSKVSVAESIAEDCSVRETEVIVERAGGTLDFWTFGADGRREAHGYFPARLGVDAIKYAPSSCMDCHYKLDTRRFDVRIPSYRALDLSLRRAGGVPQWVDGSSCARQSDTIVWHEHPHR